MAHGAPLLPWSARLGIGAAVGVLVVAGAWYGFRSLVVLEAENLPAETSRLVLSPGHEVSQELTVPYGPLRTVAVRIDAASAESEDELSVSLGTSGGPSAAVHGTVRSFRASLPDDPAFADTVLAGSWLVFRFPPARDTQGATLLVLTIRHVPAGRSLVFPYQHDSTKYAGGSLWMDGRLRAGDLAFRTYREASIGERLVRRLAVPVNRQRLLISLLGAFLLGIIADCVGRRSRGLPLVSDRPVMLVVFLSLLLAVPLATTTREWGIWDWPEAIAHYASARHSLQAGQLPLWSPYVCGGAPSWGNPQAYWPSLAFLLTLLAGDIEGTKLAIVVLLAVGAVGVMTLAREVGVRGPATLVAAVVACFSGFLMAHLAAGQILWLSFAWFPWMLAFFLRSRSRLSAVLPAALFFLLIVLEGRTHLIIYGLIAFACLAVGMSVQERDVRAVARRCGLVLLLIVLLGAVKILPTLDFLRQVQGDLPNTAGVPWRHLGDVLLTRTVAFDYREPWMTLLWHEYAAYVGPLALALAAVGAVHALVRRHVLGITLVGMGVVFLVLAGTPGSALLEHVPVVSQLRNPARALGVVVLVLGLLAARGTEIVAKRLSIGRVRQVLPLLLGLVLFADYSSMSFPALSAVFRDPPRSFAGGGASFFQSTGHANAGLPVVLAGYGAVDDCPAHLTLFQPGAMVRGREDPTYRGEVYAAQGSAVSLEQWSPNRLAVRVASVVPGGDDLIVNQKFDPGWWSPGHRPRSRDGLLTVPVVPQDAGSVVVLQYRPWSLLIGGALTGITVLGLLAVGGVRVWRRLYT